MPNGFSTSGIYRPKLITAVAEGYSAERFRKDALAALTVAIVALPLSMAIAVASGVTPERGLYTAIIGGALVSALGGSRFQIGGPAGAFIVLVAATVARFGVEGLLLTVLISGAMLTLLGVLRIGSLIGHIPHAVTVGFTCGIAVTIAASQLKDIAGLKLHGSEPGPFFPKMATLFEALPSFTPAALTLGALSALVIFGLRRARPTWPGMLIAVVLASAASFLFHLPVETIGTKFGGIPHGLLWPTLPVFSWPLVIQVLPTALSFTLLGGIESLLSAKVADGMTARFHRSNMELVAQGIANMVSAMFGRHQCHRHDCAHRDQYTRGRANPAVGHSALAIPAHVHDVRSAARELHPPRRTGGRSACGRMEHGGEGRGRGTAQGLAHGGGAACHLPADPGPRPDHRYHRWLRAGPGLSSCLASKGATLEQRQLTRGLLRSLLRRCGFCIEPRGQLGRSGHRVPGRPRCTSNRKAVSSSLRRQHRAN
jgi:SulP family sulfate permease